MADEIEDLENEHFYCLYLDIRHNLVAKKRLFIGGLTTSIINPRDIFKYAVRINAAKVIFVHNHPTGSPYPSPQDKLTTGKLVEGGKLLGIIVVDHVIIGKNNCFSILEDKIYEF